MPDLQLRDIGFRYSSGFSLQHIDLQIPEASMLALIGPNGSGKTTLLQLLAGRLSRQTGSILLDGRPLEDYTPRQRARRMAVISSEQYFQFPFPVREVVAMGRFPFLNRFQPMTDRDREVVDESMRLTRTRQFRDRSISDLSSGERQLVLIARAIAQQPAILMLDEPNSHLDVGHQITIFELLRSLSERHSMSVIMVLHDLTAAAAFSDSVALLHQGSLIRCGTPQEVITEDNIQAVYGARVNVRSSPEEGYPQVSFSRPNERHSSGLEDRATTNQEDLPS